MDAGRTKPMNEPGDREERKKAYPRLRGVNIPELPTMAVSPMTMPGENNIICRHR